MNTAGSQWIILRMAGARTLAVAESLSAAGYEVWTPIGENTTRHGRSRSRRKDLVPVMPTYAFARATHLRDLIAESKAFISPHPDFSVFRYFDRYPVISNDELDPLRVAERKRQPLESVARFDKGDFVRCSEAGFQGLSGVVELTKGKFTLVCFPGFGMPIKIHSMLLIPDEGRSFQRAA